MTEPTKGFFDTNLRCFCTTGWVESRWFGARFSTVQQRFTSKNRDKRSVSFFLSVFFVNMLALQISIYLKPCYRYCWCWRQGLGQSHWANGSGLGEIFSFPKTLMQDEGKISLSMKYCSQANGRDLDESGGTQIQHCSTVPSQHYPDSVQGKLSQNVPDVLQQERYLSCSDKKLVSSKVAELDFGPGLFSNKNNAFSSK